MLHQVRNNTIRNCLPYRPDIDWDMRNSSWEVNGKQMFFKYASDITLSNNRCITQPQDCAVQQILLYQPSRIVITGDLCWTSTLSSMGKCRSGVKQEVLMSDGAHAAISSSKRDV